MTYTRPSKPPVAHRRPHTYSYHGFTIEDPWHWLRDSGYPTVEDADVLEYLQAENEYFQRMMSPYKELTDTIFEEIKARGYNLDIKNPHTEEEDLGDPETLLEELTSAEAEVMSVRNQLKRILTEALLR